MVTSVFEDFEPFGLTRNSDVVLVSIPVSVGSGWLTEVVDDDGVATG
ncbi:hypothetical protein Hanom_Chr08g00744081 [Helianthus anomalus]